MATNFQSGARRTAIDLDCADDYELELERYLNEVVACVDRLAQEVEEVRRDLNT